MPSRRFTDEEEERLRMEYETDWDESWEIADRWGLSLSGLRNLAGSRGWRRPAPNTLVKRLKEEGPLRDHIKSMWEHDASCAEIGRYVGVTTDNTRKACEKAFGPRSLVLNHHTYMVKRNRQIHRMRYMGASVEDLAKAYRLSEITVHYIVRKLDGNTKRSGGFWRGRKVKAFDEVRRAYNQKYTSEDYEQHEAFLRALLVHASIYFKVPVHTILWDTRGKPRQMYVRQIVSYVLHCEVGLSMKRVGELIGRCYTTVGHSVRKIEDLRDDLDLDSALQTIANAFLDTIKRDMAFTSPYELYFSTKGKADEAPKLLEGPANSVRIQSRGKLGGSRRGNRDAARASDDHRG